MRVETISVGKPAVVPWDKNKVVTAIFKQPVSGKVALDRMNLVGDAQGDLKNHGGPDKAVCIYAASHYPYWEKVLNRPLSYGSFGENLTVSGLTEEDVFIGDIWRIGSATVQVSQPRQPCYKIGVRLNAANLHLQVIETGFAGFYLRVLEEGEIEAGDTVTLVERLNADYTIRELHNCLFHKNCTSDEWTRLANIPELAEPWRKAFRKKISN
ncbi:MOSC domain-containing protein [Aneurinibacillus terranovensis]|uniref:MOSC domain-containing protein n=1 Tax=Aneurinibacillus terranovensis TaxID=278991 RepID=UPI0003FD5777|nr:MOSC domain-containing protein [Aneurinibacillus terranovensis]